MISSKYAKHKEKKLLNDEEEMKKYENTRDIIIRGYIYPNLFNIWQIFKNSLKNMHLSIIFIILIQTKISPIAIVTYFYKKYTILITD